MILDVLVPSQVPKRKGQNKLCCCTRPVHVCNSQTKFSRIMDIWTGRDDFNIPSAFFFLKKKARITMNNRPMARILICLNMFHYSVKMLFIRRWVRAPNYLGIYLCEQCRYCQTPQMCTIQMTIACSL